MTKSRTSFRPYLEFIHQPVLVALRGLGFRRLTDKWIRMSNRNYAWPLHGPLDGHVMQFLWREDFQYLAPNYEPRVCGVIQRLVRPEFVCADVGAHLGYMSLLMAKLVGEKGKVHSFEALPDNAKLLRRNISLNGYAQRVQIVNAAVTDGETPTIQLYLGPSSFQSSINPEDGAGQITIPALSLDGYFEGFRRLDFIKMDIEGAEVMAVPGMRRVLEHLRPTLLLEVHDDAWSAVEVLLSAGYRLQDLDCKPMQLDEMQARKLNHCVAMP